jgi:hypothetical protein
LVEKDLPPRSEPYYGIPFMPISARSTGAWLDREAVPAAGFDHVGPAVARVRATVLTRRRQRLF